jgi:cytochrome P450
VVATWRDGERRDIHQEMTEVTLRIAARTLFGTELAEDVALLRGTNAIATDHFRSRLFSLMILVPDGFPTPGNLRYARAVRDIRGLVRRIIDERRAAGAETDDLLGLLLSARDEAGRGMSDRQLRDEAVTLLLAGHDTTALTLTWAWMLLANHPEAEARLHRELDAVLGDRDHPPTPDDVPRLSYAGQIVAETLRLYPSAWMIGREAVTDTQIGGQRVAKGLTILISPWVMHRDPRFFDQPQEFRPERWANGLAERLPRYAYLPFGGGQRVCIGSGFAQLEAVLLLATIARRFRLALAEPGRVVELLPVVTLRPKGGLPMLLRAR